MINLIFVHIWKAPFLLFNSEHIVIVYVVVKCNESGGMMTHLYGLSVIVQ